VGDQNVDGPTSENRSLADQSAVSQNVGHQFAGDQIAANRCGAYRSVACPIEAYQSVACQSVMNRTGVGRISAQPVFCPEGVCPPVYRKVVVVCRCCS
jgi:hypothetical protein